MPTILPEFAERLRVLDHSGRMTCWVDAPHARKLIASGGFTVLCTKRKVRGLKACSNVSLSAVERLDLRAMHQQGVGDPHRHASETNVEGNWTLDYIRESLAPHFGLRKPAAA